MSTVGEFKLTKVIIVLCVLEQEVVTVVHALGRGLENKETRFICATPFIEPEIHACPSLPKSAQACPTISMFSLNARR
jgi:hypothetical protein